VFKSGAGWVSAKGSSLSIYLVFTCSQFPPFGMRVMPPCDLPIVGGEKPWRLGAWCDFVLPSDGRDQLS